MWFYSIDAFAVEFIRIFILLFLFLFHFAIVWVSVRVCLWHKSIFINFYRNIFCYNSTIIQLMMTIIKMMCTQYSLSRFESISSIKYCRGFCSELIQRGQIDRYTLFWDVCNLKINIFFAVVMKNGMSVCTACVLGTRPEIYSKHKIEFSSLFQISLKS